MSANPIWIAGYFGPVAGASPVWIAPGDGTVPSAVQSEVVSYFAPVAGATAVWIAGFFAPPPAAIGATPITISGWGGSGGGGGGGSTSVWSAADASANGMTLSNGGLTLSGTAPGLWRTTRSSISKTSGKLYVEFYVTAETSAQIFGLADVGFSIAASNAYLGSSVYSAGIGTDAGGCPVAGFDAAHYTNTPALAVNDVWALAVDFSVGSIWVAKNNVWSNSSNPATGSLPIVTFTPASVPPLFAAVSFFTGVATVTLQSTAASQKYAPPSGFVAWDGGTAPPPTSVWSAADASANAMTLSNGGLTVTTSGVNAWRAIRSSTSKTSGKLYIEFLNSVSVSSYEAWGLASTGFNPVGNLGDTNFSGASANNGFNIVSSGFTDLLGIPATSVGIGDVWALAVDFGAGYVWVARNNVWAQGLAKDPASGAQALLRFVLATTGPLFASMSFYGTVGVWTLQSTAASQKYAPPSGFSAWDSGS